MILEYKLTKGDFLDFNLYHAENTPNIKKSLFIQRYIFSLIILLIPVIVNNYRPISFTYWMLLSIGIYIIWIISYMKYYRLDLKRKLSKMLSDDNNQHLLDKRLIGFTEEGILETSPRGQSIARWESIEKIGESEDNIFIYVSEVSSIIIPKRSFMNEEEKQNFIDEIKRNRI